MLYNEIDDAEKNEAHGKRKVSIQSYELCETSKLTDDLTLNFFLQHQSWYYASSILSYPSSLEGDRLSPTNLPAKDIEPEKEMAPPPTESTTRCSGSKG